MKAIVSVIGEDRIGIVYEVSKLLAQAKVNILNMTQQLLDGYFTMILVVDLSRCEEDVTVLAEQFADYGREHALDIRLKSEALFTAMHRI